MSPRARSILSLGLPLTNVGAAWGSAALVLAVYAATMARDLTFYDSPELALVARQLGLGHPIGEPLHTWLGFVATHLPGIDPLIALTAMSAIFGALAIVPAFALAERLAGDAARPIVIAPPLIAAALHPIAWDPSTRIEVYTLAAFLALWALARLSAAEGRAWPIGLALGLAASANAVVAAAHALAVAPRVIAGRGARDLALAIAAGLAGLSPYALVLVVGGDRTRFVWGAPETPAALFAYLRGADYAHNAGIDAGGFIAHLGALAAWSAREASLPIALAGLATFVWRARGLSGLRWSLPIVASLCVAFVARNAVFHTDVPDYRGYLFAPWLVASAGVAALAAVIFTRGDRFRVYGGLVALLPLAAVGVAPSHLAGPRDTPSLARIMADGALTDAPRNAIVLVESDHWVAPLLYAQEAEGTRPDVVLVPHGLASSSWYWEHLYARHPDLASIELRGPGGRDGRIRRFLDANADRPVLVESVALAERAGRPPCAVSWLLRTGSACLDAPPASIATAAIDRAHPLRGEALEVAGAVSLARGEALFRLGRGAEAYDALLAGIGAALPAPPPHPDLPEHAPALHGALPGWSRPAAIHDPASNVAIAALVLDALGRRRDALEVASLAEAMGLPEAGELLAATSR